MITRKRWLAMLLLTACGSSPGDAPPDAAPPDLRPGEDLRPPEDLADAGLVATVCGNGVNDPHTLSDLLPVPAGTAHVAVMAFGLDVGLMSGAARLTGPETLTVALPDVGCMFEAKAGHYAIEVRDGAGALIHQGAIDLGDGQAAALAVYRSADQGARAYPLDTSIPADGKWRYHFLHLAQDNFSKPLDLYWYPTPWDGTPDANGRHLLAAGVPYGEMRAFELQALTETFEFQPAGVLPDEKNAVQWAVPWMADRPAVLVATIWCDTNELFDGGPCHGQAGAGVFGAIIPH